MTPFSVSHDCKISCLCGRPPADRRLGPALIYTLRFGIRRFRDSVLCKGPNGGKLKLGLKWTPNLGPAVKV